MKLEVSNPNLVLAILSKSFPKQLGVSTSSHFVVDSRVTRTLAWAERSIASAMAEERA